MPQAVEHVVVRVAVEDQEDHIIVVVLVYIKHVEIRGEGRLAFLRVRDDILMETIDFGRIRLFLLMLKHHLLTIVILYK